VNPPITLQRGSNKRFNSLLAGHIGVYEDTADFLCDPGAAGAVNVRHDDATPLGSKQPRGSFPYAAGSTRDDRNPVLEPCHARLPVQSCYCHNACCCLVQPSSEYGFSISPRRALRKVAPTAPSITRWSQDMVTVITEW